jgi:hypothetical protein
MMKKVVNALATKSACVLYWSDGTRTLDAEHEIVKVATPQNEEVQEVRTTEKAVDLGCIGFIWDKVRKG